MSARRYILTMSCPDRTGIVAAVSGLIAQHRGWIVEASYHADQVDQWFFMRNEVLAESLPFDLPEFRRLLAPLAEQFNMAWSVHDTAVRKRVVVLVSRQDHCLSDLLHRWRSGELEFELAGVISNHEDLRGFVEWHGVPFAHVPVTAETRGAAFAEVGRLLAEHRAELVVLARYMQILPPELCRQFAGRVINIHHGFLPSFAGGKPYHQAYAKGVKLIGATCHFVTAELDQGPIIEQDVIRVDHGDTVDDMVALGRDVEKTVLARSLRYVLQDRVLIHRHKTVVFR